MLRDGSVPAACALNYLYKTIAYTRGSIAERCRATAAQAPAQPASKPPPITSSGRVRRTGRSRRIRRHTARSSRSSGPLSSSEPGAEQQRAPRARRAAPYQNPMYRNGRRTKASVAPSSFDDLDLLAPVLDVEADRVADDHDHGTDQQHRGDPHRAPHDVENRREPRQPLGIELHQVDFGPRRELGLRCASCSGRGLGGRPHHERVWQGIALQDLEHVAERRILAELRERVVGRNDFRLRRCRPALFSDARQVAAPRPARCRASGRRRSRGCPASCRRISGRSAPSTCRLAGSASAMPITATVSAVATGWRLSWPERRQRVLQVPREPARSCVRRSRALGAGDRQRRSPRRAAPRPGAGRRAGR